MMKATIGVSGGIPKMMELIGGGQDRHIVWIVKTDIMEEKYRIDIPVVMGKTMERNEVDMMAGGHLVRFVLLCACFCSPIGSFACRIYMWKLFMRQLFFSVKGQVSGDLTI